jgi:hypothetical protein
VLSKQAVTITEVQFSILERVTLRTLVIVRNMHAATFRTMNIIDHTYFCTMRKRNDAG